jgi:hypothetical protein
MKGMERKCSMHREERNADLKTLREDIKQMGDLSVNGKVLWDWNVSFCV